MISLRSLGLTDARHRRFALRSVREGRRAVVRRLGYVNAHPSALPIERTSRETLAAMVNEALALALVASATCRLGLHDPLKERASDMDTHMAIASKLEIKLAGLRRPA